MQSCVPLGPGKFHVVVLVIIIVVVVVAVVVIIRSDLPIFIDLSIDKSIPIFID